jgi:hypothetical protein
LRVIEVIFLEERIVKLTVEMPDLNRYTTDKVPHLPRLLFKMFPHMEHHRCDNGRGYTFRKEAEATEIPHLLEHLIIELQGQALHHDVLKGETQWNWQVDPRGRFHVYVQYENELLVLAAIRIAEKIINALDNRELSLLNLADELERLKEIAQLGLALGSSANLQSSEESVAA